MNRRQQIVLFVIVGALVATWLFPPWNETINESSREGPSSQEFLSLGYHFLFTWAPSGQYLFTIDLARLLLADLIIATLGGWLLYTLRSKA